MKKTLIVFSLLFINTYAQSIKLGFQLDGVYEKLSYVREVAFQKFDDGGRIMNYPSLSAVMGVKINDFIDVDVRAGVGLYVYSYPFEIGIYPKVRFYESFSVLGAYVHMNEGEDSHNSDGFYGLNQNVFGLGLSYKINHFISIEYLHYFMKSQPHYYLRDVNIGKIKASEVNSIMKLGLNLSWSVLEF